MTLLKRLKVPLYYLKKRKGKSGEQSQIVLELFEKSLYVKPEDLMIIDVNVAGYKTKDKKKGDEKKGAKKQKGEFSARIEFANNNLTKHQKNEIKSILSDALVSKKAHNYFHDLIVTAMRHAGDDDSSLYSDLGIMQNKKTLYHFHHRSSSKSGVLYSIIPDSRIPRTYANKEMMENFLYNIAIAELDMSIIKGIKSVKIS